MITSNALAYFASLQVEVKLMLIGQFPIQRHLRCFPNEDRFYSKRMIEDFRQLARDYQIGRDIESTCGFGRMFQRFCFSIDPSMPNDSAKFIY